MKGLTLTETLDIFGYRTTDGKNYKRNIYHHDNYIGSMRWDEVWDHLENIAYTCNGHKKCEGERFGGCQYCLKIYKSGVTDD